jgi:probable HAF family extracellular repeat protein
MGTFGGPNSWASSAAISITPAGAVGLADTPIPDPLCFYDCMVGHAFWWRNGTTVDIGELPGNNGGNSAYAFAINNTGLIVGVSENGAIDRITGFPSTSPVAWLNGHIFNLGGFGGTQGAAMMVNDRGQITGSSTNTITDPYALSAYFPAATQARAFVWEHGVLRDLGTLGGPDAVAVVISQSGLIVGQSYTSFKTNPGSGIPTLDPFLWDGRTMIDLGTLGGTAGYAYWVNNKGQVVGQSNLVGDQAYHGFLWDHGVMTDLGTLGGPLSGVWWINENGVIAGEAEVPDGSTSAAIWVHGQILNLGRFPGDNIANAFSVNDAQQVVGSSCLLPCSDWAVWHAFLWENSGPMVDLNALVNPPSDINVKRPDEIDDRGVIVGLGQLPNGDIHAVVLVPMGDCDSDCERRIANSQNNPAPTNPALGAAPRLFGKAGIGLRNPFGRR